MPDIIFFLKNFFSSVTAGGELLLDGREKGLQGPRRPLIVLLSMFPHKLLLIALREAYRAMLLFCSV